MNYKRRRPKRQARACACKFGKQDGNQKEPFEKVVDPEVVKAWPAKKDTRHWCRGKVGVPHKFEWRQAEHTASFTWIEVCASCGRHGRFCSRYPWIRMYRDQKCICGHHGAGVTSPQFVVGRAG